MSGPENVDAHNLDLDVNALTQKLSTYLDQHVFSNRAQTIIADHIPLANTPSLGPGNIVSSAPETTIDYSQLDTIDEDIFFPDMESRQRIISCFQVDTDKGGKEYTTIARDEYRDSTGQTTGKFWYSIHKLRVEEGKAILESFDWHSDANEATDISENPVTDDGVILFIERGGNTRLIVPDIGNVTFSFMQGHSNAFLNTPESNVPVHTEARARLIRLLENLKQLTEGRHFAPGMLQKAAKFEETSSFNAVKVTRPPIIDSGN